MMCCGRRMPQFPMYWICKKMWTETDEGKMDKLTQTVLIMNSLGNNSKYTIRLVLKDEVELELVKKALEPLGFRFRFPER